MRAPLSAFAIERVGERSADVRRGVGGRLVLGVGAGHLIEHQRELADRLRNRPDGILVGVERHHAGAAGQAARGADRGQRRERRRVRQRVAGVGAEAERGEAGRDGGRGAAARAGRAQRRIERVADRAADGADAEVAERKLVEVRLAEHRPRRRAACRRPRANRAAADDRRSARDPPVVGRPSTSMLSLKITGMPCSGPRTPPAARSASRRTRVGDRRRIEREHRAQRRPVAIEQRQPRQILADDVLRRRVAARQRVLDLRDGLLDDGERRRRRGGGGNAPVDDLRSLQRRQAAEIGRRDEAARDRRSRARSRIPPRESSARRPRTAPSISARPAHRAAESEIRRADRRPRSGPSRRTSSARRSVPACSVSVKT